jgi:release factor glutamine methyltransferase
MGVNIQTIKDIRFYLARELGAIYSETEINAITNIIIRNVLGISKLPQLYMNGQTVSARHATRITDICSELKTGKPLQYVLGETIFYGCTIRVNSSTLIPRQETEELVDLIIRENKGYNGVIVDIGTGSGCIAIALAVNLPGSEVTGTDISDRAIVTAKENALLNKVSVTFEKSDIFTVDPVKVKKAGIIVSNPPYVRNSEKQFMNKNILEFEPHTALFVPDSDPLKYYSGILEFAVESLMPSGRLYFEINETMGSPMVVLMEKFKYCGIEVIADINGRDRIIKGIKNG